MVISVDVDIDTTDNLGPKTRRAITKYLKSGADKGFEIYLDRMPVDRANMQQNSYSPEEDSQGRIRYGTRDIPYARAQDEGTEGYWAPIQPLKDWADRIGRDEGFAYYVQWKIAQDGIEPKHFSRDAQEAQARWYRSHDASEWINRELR